MKRTPAIPFDFDHSRFAYSFKHSGIRENKPLTSDHHHNPTTQPPNLPTHVSSAWCKNITLIKRKLPWSLLSLSLKSLWFASVVSACLVRGWGYGWADYAGGAVVGSLSPLGASGVSSASRGSILISFGCALEATESSLQTKFSR